MTATGKLAGRIAVVTGASRGIGRAIATLFAHQGARVAGCGIQGPFDAHGRGEGFLEDLGPDLRGASIFVSCDVRQATDVARFRETVLIDLGTPDILVNNAGTVVRARFAEHSEADWDEVVASNLKGSFLFTRAFVPDMLKRHTGRIVNIASIAGRQGTAMLAAYCAAKHGVVGLTRALAEELRPEGIAVNAICPGSVDTEMLPVGMPGAEPRMTVEEVAGVALYLAADAPIVLTGACLDVFG